MSNHGGKREGAGRKKAGPKFGEWVSVEDALPKNNSEVLAVMLGASTKVYESYYIDGVFLNLHYAVTHWMPLPEPPKA